MVSLRMRYRGVAVTSKVGESVFFVVAMSSVESFALLEL